MSTATNVSIGTAAAAAILGGGLLLTNLITDEPVSEEPTPIVETAYVDDITGISVNIPSITVPTIAIPQIDIPKIIIPYVEVPKELLLDLNLYILEEINLDNIDVPTPSLSYYISVYEKELKNAGIRTITTVGGKTYAAIPKASVPSISSADNAIVIPSISTATVASIDNAIVLPSADAANLVSIEENIVVPKVSPANVVIPTLVTPAVTKADNRLPQLAAFMEEVDNRFKDKRNIMYDASINMDNVVFQKWLDIYRNHKPYRMIKKDLPSGINMIAEIRVPISTIEEKILSDNLSYYKNKDYNSALFVVYGTESMGSILRTIHTIRSHDLDCYIAYSGPERLNHSVFIDPTRLKSILSACAPLCKGFLTGWRRTALHLLEQDTPFTDYLISCVRDSNPDILILGEGYYGQTASSRLSTRHLSYNIPENSSGAILVGVGYNRINVNGVINKLFSRISHVPKLVVITGDRPYYATRNFNHKSFEENLAIKQRLAQRFLKSGCVGTITLHGDGSDGIYNQAVTDNLSATPVN